MVYCVNCGAKNADEATFCLKCGHDLRRARAEPWEERIEAWGDAFGQRAERWGEDFGRQVETACFGLPRVGVVLGLFLGAVVLLAGVELLLGWTVVGVLRSVGALVTVLFGVVVILLALRVLRRGTRSSS
jgi:hypothetical protein